MASKVGWVRAGSVEHVCDPSAREETTWSADIHDHPCEGYMEYCLNFFQSKLLSDPGMGRLKQNDCCDLWLYSKLNPSLAYRVRACLIFKKRKQIKLTRKRDMGSLDKLHIWTFPLLLRGISCQVDLISWCFYFSVHEGKFPCSSTTKCLFWV